MKKLLKKVSLVTALLVCFAMTFPMMMSTVATLRADSPFGYSVLTEEIVVSGFIDEGTKGIPYTIQPGTVTVDGLTEPAMVKVFNPYGTEVTVTENQFTPQYAGFYTVRYSHGDNSTDLTVEVSGIIQGVEIKFEQNDKFIVPSIVNPKNNDSAVEIILPNPKVVDKNGDVDETAVIDISVTFAGAEVATYTLTEDGHTDEDEQKHDVLRLDPEKNGTYTVSYKNKVGGQVVAFAEKKIKADKTYKNDYEFTYDYNSTKPTSAEIGVARKLPSVTATNKDTKKAVEVYYTVKAEHKAGSTVTTYLLGEDNGVISIKDGEFYFTPIKDGDYTITYTVENFFGKEASVSSSTFPIEDVKDTTDPVPVIVMPYSDEDLTQGITQGVKYLAEEDYIIADEAIVSNIINENILLFPIYATDAANGIVENNLTLYRTIKDAGNNTVFNESTDIEGNVNNKILVFNSNLAIDPDVPNPENVVTTVYINGKAYDIKEKEVYIVPEPNPDEDIKGYKFGTSGTHTITYVAKDKAGNGIATKQLTMRVDSSFEDDENPVVKFAENLPTAILLDNEVKFKTPTASDNKDTRLSVYLTYKTTVAGVESAEVRVDDENSIISYDKDNEYPYSFTITDNKIEKITIIANSRDDNGNIGTAEQTILVLNSGDTEATSIISNDINVNDAADYVQGNEIILPTVVYEDDLIDYLNVEIRIVNDGVEYKAYNVERVKNYTDNTMTVQGANFGANAAGDYEITYISTDAANNKTIIKFNLYIKEDLSSLVIQFTQLPSQINNGTAEKDETIEFPIPTLELGSDDLKIDGKYRVEITGPANYKLVSDIFFTPEIIGTYSIQYIADVMDISGGEPGILFKTVTSKIYTIDVKDTTGPVFEGFKRIESYFADLNATGVDSGTEINLIEEELLPESVSPDVDMKNSYITISSSSTVSKTIYLNETDKLESCKFNGNDTFTLTYTLVDKTGNKTEKSVTLDVGDVKPPILDIDDDLLKDEYKIGDVISIDLSKISADDEVDGEILIYDEETGQYSLKYKATMKVVIRNTTTGEELENELDEKDLKFQFTIATAGEYTVSIQISDTSNKVAINDDFAFTVAEDSNKGMTAEEILGTVLVIVSLVLLGGVIVYFIVSKKKLDKKYK